MAYTDCCQKRLIELAKSIESHKEHQYAAPTYKDVPALNEMAQIVKTQLESEKMHDKSTLTDSITVLRYLADAFESMWRIAYTVKYHARLLELQAELYERFSETDDNFADDYYKALRARNYYQNDDCADLKRLARIILPTEDCKDIENRLIGQKQRLLRDPVELSEKYLSVIDEVERKIDESGIDKGLTHGRVQLKAKLLNEYGIDWKSVICLNPNVHFD